MLKDLKRALGPKAKVDFLDAVLNAEGSLLDSIGALNKRINRLKDTSPKRADLIRERNRLDASYAILAGLDDLLFQEPALGLCDFLRDQIATNPKPVK